VAQVRKQADFRILHFIYILSKRLRPLVGVRPTRSEKGGPMKRLVIVALVLALVAPTLAAAVPAPPHQAAIIEDFMRWISGILRPTTSPRPPVHIECSSALTPDGRCI
jgi:hypothetical protein